MKRKTAVLGALVSLFAAAALASESFTLDIPLRFNAQQETGKVLVTLTLNAAPAGAQLVVNGSTTLNLGGSTNLGSGDTVKFESGVGNEVKITYQPLSNFGADFCAGGSAVGKSVPMRFAGAQDVTDYRISTYIVAAPEAECSQVAKHTGDSPATLTPVDDGVASALVATNRGRHTYDVVLVLDKSGSMSDFPPGAISGPKKHEILKSAVQAFVTGWQQIDAPLATGEEWSNDRMGVVFFDSAVTPQTLPGADPPANFFLKRGAGSAWDAVSSNVLGLNPGSATSIGGGINEAMKQWKADPDNDLTVIVATDGMQNTAPLILPTPSGFLGLDPVSGLPQELRKRFIPIQTIGFGAPEQVDEDLLRYTSFETSGVSYIAVSASTMFDVFASTLVAILKGNTASLAEREHGTLTGKGPTAGLAVDVDRSAQRVVFMAQWAPPAREALELEVLPPGAASPAVPTSSAKTPQAAFQTFDLKPGAVGTWKVRVKRGSNGSNEPVPYTLNVLFLERHLDYRLSFDQIHAGTGDRLGIRATVSWDGKPLTGLPADAIRVRVARPPVAAGNILHEARVPDRVNGPVKTPSGEVETPYNRKVNALIRSGALGRTAPKDVATITLKEQGRGVYATTFDDTSIPGTYAFETTLDWNDPRTGHTHREERLEQFVKAKADPAKTEVKTTRTDPRIVSIAVTPRDRFGNFIGPGAAVKLKLKSAGKLASETPVDRGQTGTYIFTITGVPAGKTPDVEITVDGVRVSP
ncbi:MAG: vWA domain-containing protein [Acidobacteriota bacterium]